MARTLNRPTRLLLTVLTVAGVGYGVNYGVTHYAPPPPASKSTVPPVAQLPEVPVRPVAHAGADTSVPPRVTLPAPAARVNARPLIRSHIWAWQAQTALISANGGAHTAEGSLIDKVGINLELVRQDDVAQNQNELILFAQALANGERQPQVGTHFVTIMGDGSAAFLKGVNSQLERLGRPYRARIAGHFGYSVGEDKLMGPQAWKDDPHSMIGKTICGYLRDGDWNISLKFQGDNGIPNNPDETSYDSAAVNWIAANDFIDAAKKYTDGYSESRKDKRTGKNVTVQCDGVVTWTPGDVIVAKKRGGLVSIVSTREYRWQMPSVLIGIDSWMQANPQIVEGIMAAAFQKAEVLKADPDYTSDRSFDQLPVDSPLRQAMILNTKVFNEETPAYWLRYFRGVTERDAQGLNVELGGSSVSDLADAAQLFGIDEGGYNIMSAVYTTFGNLVTQQYPDILPTLDPASEAIDDRYVRDLWQKAQRDNVPLTAPERPVFAASAPIKQVVSKKSYSIEFDTGKATIRPESLPQMQDMLAQIITAGGLAVELHGHTDNTGNPTKNMSLSESRAFAVRDWLQAQAPNLFPNDAANRRLRVSAHGQTMPIAPNDTEAGRAKNRRVDVILGVNS